MGMEGVDYAWDRPDLDTLWAAGRRFVCRYLAYLPNGKVLQRSELEALHGKGFAVVLNWEQAAGDMLRGYDVGVRHAQEALRQANALGAPAHIPIYFSCDVDTNITQRLSVAMYLDGCASVLGKSRVGVYGEYDVIETMVPSHAAWGWLTYAWSSGKVSSRAHIYQYRNGVQLAGADCDLNRQLQPDIGAWYPDQGEDMDATQAETLNRIDRRVTTLLYNLPTNQFGDGGERNQLKEELDQILAKVGGGSVYTGVSASDLQAALLAVLQSPEGKAAIVAAVNQAEDS